MHRKLEYENTSVSRKVTAEEWDSFSFLEVVGSGSFPWKRWCSNWSLMDEVAEVERGERPFKVAASHLWHSILTSFEALHIWSCLWNMARWFQWTFFGWQNMWKTFILIAMCFVLYCKLTNSSIESIVYNLMNQVFINFLLSEISPFWRTSVSSVCYHSPIYYFC